MPYADPADHAAAVRRYRLTEEVRARNPRPGYRRGYASLDLPNGAPPRFAEYMELVREILHPMSVPDKIEWLREFTPSLYHIAMEHDWFGD